MATAEGSPNLQPQATLRRRSSTPEKPTDSALDQVEIPSAPTAVAPPRLKMSCRRRAHPPTPKGRRDLPGLPSGGAWLKQSPQARRFLEILLGRVAGFSCGGRARRSTHIWDRRSIVFHQIPFRVRSPLSRRCPFVSALIDAGLARLLRGRTRVSRDDVGQTASEVEPRLPKPEYPQPSSALTPV